MGPPELNSELCLPLVSRDSLRSATIDALPMGHGEGMGPNRLAGPRAQVETLNGSVKNQKSHSATLHDVTYILLHSPEVSS